MLEEFLRSRGRAVVACREPGGTEVGEEVRTLLKRKDFSNPPTAEVELLLFLASRAQLVRERILPALGRGEIVLCDRYGDSTTAYQCGARALPAEPVESLSRFAAAGCVPDLTILLDLPPALGFSRIRASRGGQSDRLEEESLVFFERVRSAYLRIAAANPGRLCVIDATQSLEEVQRALRSAVAERLPGAV
jgi:dTMP kinase